MTLSCRAATLFLFLALGPALSAHDGAKFEPPDGMVIHGAGQDLVGFKSYEAALAVQCH